MASLGAAHLPLLRRVASLVAAVAMCGACTAGPGPEPGVAVIVAEQQSSWVRNFNPFLPAGVSRWGSRFVIHEPLAVFSGTQQVFVPWLATSWTWSDDRTRLVVQLRQGVAWSDGAPFTADDVVFTFRLMLRTRALDTQLLSGFLADVRAEDGAVVFDLKHAYSPGLADILQVPIVPAHVWADVDDPVAFANPNPVGTGPYTAVAAFSDQSFELGRNPHAWARVERPLRALRFPAMMSNEQVTQGLARGEIDWAGAFVPQPERVFVDGDREHRDAWSPPLGGMVFLYASHLTPPFDQQAVREAISLAIDRERVVDTALQGLTVASPASGMSDALGAWRDPSVACSWIGHDPSRAVALLEQAGGVRDSRGWFQFDGAPFAPDVAVVAGWSDQVRAARLVVRDLQAIGVHAHLRTLDFGAWYDRLQRGEFALSFGWSLEGASPYVYWRSLLSEATRKPQGEPVQVNWQRSGDVRSDALLEQLASAQSDDLAQAAAFGLHRRFCEVAPAIPLYPNPAWGEANTARVTGFPTSDDPYARLSPNHPPEPLLVVARLEAR
jgi:peptide/nickel transport system substrate-binding protein